MKHLALVTAAGLLIGMTAGVSAQTSNAPGLQMQEKGSVKGSPGASGYAPGHQMQEKGSVKGTTGASGYAPGHATTGSSVNSNSRMKSGGGKTDIDTNTKAKVR